MARLFSVGALAIATEGANAVGAVRLTLGPEELEIELLRAGSFSDQFVPGALVEMVRFSVPYLAVRGLIRRGDALCLALDPTAATPFNRFTLSRFTDAPLDALVGAHRNRAIVRGLSKLLPVPVGAAAAIAMPGAWVGSAGAVAVFALVAWATRSGLRKWCDWLSFGGPISRRFRDAFEARLADRLGLFPAKTEPEASLDVPFDTPRPAEVYLPPRRQESSRYRGLALAFGLATLFLAVLVGYRELAIEPLAPAEEEAVELAESGLAEALDAELPAGDTEAEPARELPPAYPPCTCVRADSPLWRDGLPELSLLPSSPFPGDDGRPRGDIAPYEEDGSFFYEFDLAVVNNTSESLHDVRTVLTFARRNRAGERVGVTDRGLFWEGALGAGRAVKWRVEGPGTEVRIDAPFQSELREGDVAPADRFFELTRASQRVVRLHASMMLAYLGDPRARDAALALSELSPDEETVQKAILRAAEPLRVCSPDYERETVCLFNASDKPQKAITIIEHGAGAAARSVDIPETLEVHSGYLVPFPLGDGEPPRELVAELGSGR